MDYSDVDVELHFPDVEPDAELPIQDPEMYLFLKKQTVQLPRNMGILNAIWENLLNEMKFQENNNIPKIRSRGFAFAAPINQDIDDNATTILMLVEAGTGDPCAVLLFTYNTSVGLHIDILDGDKTKKQPCGGGATYLLDIFCKSVDNITPIGKTIKISLYDASKNKIIYDNFFSEIFPKTKLTSKNGITSISGPRHRNSQTPNRFQKIPLQRQVSGPFTGKVEEVYSIQRGNYNVQNLRNYKIIPYLDTDTTEDMYGDMGQDMDGDMGRVMDSFGHSDNEFHVRDDGLQISSVNMQAVKKNMIFLIMEINKYIAEGNINYLSKIIEENESLKKFLIREKYNKTRFTGHAHAIIFSLPIMQTGGYTKIKTKKNKRRSKMKIKSQRYKMN